MAHIALVLAVPRRGALPRQQLAREDLVRLPGMGKHFHELGAGLSSSLLSRRPSTSIEA